MVNYVTGTPQAFKYHKMTLSSLLNLSSEVSLTLVKWAKVNGTHYKISTIITKDILEDPIFASIIYIFLYAQTELLLE